MQPTKVKLTKNWWKMALMYKRFAITDYPKSDFSQKAAEEMFLFESRGLKMSNPDSNGFALGKKWMDVTISAWKEDLLSGGLFIHELLEEYPKWFLEKVGVMITPKVVHSAWWFSVPEFKNTRETQSFIQEESFQSQSLLSLLVNPPAK